MKKFLLSAIIALSSSFCYSSDFGIWASAVRLHVNGSPGFYNTKYLNGAGSIGNNNFGGFLGVFANNSGTLSIDGAEIKTFRQNGSNICNATFYYAIYRAGNRPDYPAFKGVNLSLYNDQVWQKVSQDIDLTNYPIGNYILEVYYQAMGDSASATGCRQYKTDNNNNQYYITEFAIAAPLAISLTALNGTTSANSVKVRWGIANDMEVEKYELQKSDNGLNFEPIGNVKAMRTGTICNYTFEDKAPIIGSNYYRIKILNRNNTVNLTKVIRIYFGKVGNTIFIYPNPSGSELAVRFAAIKKGNYQMSVFNSDGQRIIALPVSHDGNDKTIRTQLPQAISHGIYWLFLIDKVGFYKQSFIVR